MLHALTKGCVSALLVVTVGCAGQAPTDAMPSTPAGDVAKLDRPSASGKPIELQIAKGTAAVSEQITGVLPAIQDTRKLDCNQSTPQDAIFPNFTADAINDFTVAFTCTGRFGNANPMQITFSGDVRFIGGDLDFSIANTKLIKFDPAS
jgi:hypothetical protein